MTPWNRPEDAEARELFKKYLQDKMEAAANDLDTITDKMKKLTIEDYSYRPEIFSEVSEDEAYEIYWASEAASRAESR
jgi:hypothetical protein